MKLNEVYNGDCFELMKQLPDHSIDAVITDPPYGIGIDEWDKKVNIGELTKEIKRVLKPEGFYAFFGQMPTITDWIHEADKNFKYCEHISWVKRNCTPQIRLSRTFENIMVYRLNRSKFYQNKGKYSDLKIDGMYFDIVNVITIKNTMKELFKALESTDLKYREDVSKKSHEVYERFNRLKNEKIRPEVNFTNVWSFLPENQARKEKNREDYQHPTKKPVLLMERLIEMLTEKNMTVLDPFLGSGTTALACVNTGRNYIGFELSPEYCEISRKRINEAIKNNCAEN